MNQLMVWDWVVLGIVLGPAACLAIYFVARLISAAYFQSKKHFIKELTHHGVEERRQD